MRGEKSALGRVGVGGIGIDRAEVGTGSAGVEMVGGAVGVGWRREGGGRATAAAKACGKRDACVLS